MCTYLATKLCKHSNELCRQTCAHAVEQSAAFLGLGALLKLEPDNF